MTATSAGGGSRAGLIGRLLGGIAEDIGPLAAPVRLLRAKPIPAGIGWPHVLGSLLLALLGLQAVTGVLLELYYCPSTDAAHDSVRYIESSVTFGRLIRGAHHVGATGVVAVLALHLVRTFVWGAYKKPRRVLWITGCLLLLTVLAFGYTGYLLPWDMRAYFGTRVGTSIPAQIPLVGPAIGRLLVGGSEVSQITLSRFHAAHVAILPLVLAALAAAHLGTLLALGITPPGSRVGETAPAVRTFYPFQAAKDGAAILLGVGVVLALGLRGAPLGPPADPTDPFYVPRPEWYFLWLQQLLRLVGPDQQALAAALVPPVLLAILFGLPLLDRSPERHPAKRRVVVVLGGAALAAIGWLTVDGWRSASAEEAAMERRREAASRRASEPPAEPDAAIMERGRALFDGLRCARCHPEGDREEGEDLAPLDGVPSLRAEGSKVRQVWLVDFLQDPHRIYYAPEAEPGTWPTVRMPDFDLSGPEARALTAFLDTRVEPPRVPPRYDAAGSTPERRQRGEEAFRQYLCIQCHRVRDEGGQVGPDMSDAGRRLEPDFMMAMMENPYRINPMSRMRRTIPQGPDAEAIMQAIADYLAAQAGPR